MKDNKYEELLTVIGAMRAEIVALKNEVDNLRAENAGQNRIINNLTYVAKCCASLARGEKVYPRNIEVMVEEIKREMETPKNSKLKKN